MHSTEQSVGITAGGFATDIIFISVYHKCRHIVITLSRKNRESRYVSIFAIQKKVFVTNCFITDTFTISSIFSHIF